MIEKRLILILFLVMIIIQCEDNTDSQDSSNNCGIETTYIKDVDNIDSLGNASGSTIRMVDDCSYVGVGHRAGVPWITKFNELGEQVWDKKFDEIPIPQGIMALDLFMLRALTKRMMGVLSSPVPQRSTIQATMLQDAS